MGCVEGRPQPSEIREVGFSDQTTGGATPQPAPEVAPTPPPPHWTEIEEVRTRRPIRAQFPKAPSQVAGRLAPVPEESASPSARSGELIRLDPVDWEALHGESLASYSRNRELGSGSRSPDVPLAAVCPPPPRPSRRPPAAPAVKAPPPPEAYIPSSAAVRFQRQDSYRDVLIRHSRHSRLINFPDRRGSRTELERHNELEELRWCSLLLGAQRSCARWVCRALFKRKTRVLARQKAGVAQLSPARERELKWFEGLASRITVALRKCNAEDGRARGAAILSIEYLGILKRHHEEIRVFGRGRSFTDDWLGVQKKERQHWLKGG